jgi:hypothetical protein
MPVKDILVGIDLLITVLLALTFRSSALEFLGTLHSKTFQGVPGTFPGESLERLGTA